jgi:ferredoxin-NADP reductase/MOSC domain-containing protein YiiM/ferredoxin
LRLTEAADPGLPLRGTKAVLLLLEVHAMNRVVSVNVGLPRELEWRGKTIRTAIFKQPVAGRVFARRLNLVGDGQADLAGHGGEQRALMVYQLDSYRFWEKYLQRSDFAYGQFGENLTVEGLADTEVCIGDRFRIGGAVFEVTQPRVTCYKVGMRLNQPQTPALMVAERRPGFYFRVIQEGEIGAGDAIEKIADGPEHLTVADVDSLLYTAPHPAERLRQAVRLQALSPGWKASFEALLRASERGIETGNAGLTAAARPPAWPGFRTLAVVECRQECDDVRSFELAASDGSMLADFSPGQHIVLRLQPNPALAAVMRNYSLCGPRGTARFRIAVKNERGLASRFLNERLQVGDRVEASAPRGSFTLEPDTTPVVFLSAGIGVTPLLAMLHAASAPGNSTREVWWVHSARDRRHHAFAAEARDLLKTLKQVHTCNIYSQPGAQDRIGSDYDEQGHLSLALLRQTGVPARAQFYLCGPPGYLNDTQVMLQELGVDASRIHVEVFGSAPPLAPGVVVSQPQPPHPPDGIQGTGPVVTFVRSGLAVHWSTRFNNLLELAEACSVPVRWSCRTGVCHNCESGLIGGTFEYSPEPIDRPPSGIALICCAEPTSDIQLDL